MQKNWGLLFFFLGTFSHCAPSLQTSGISSSLANLADSSLGLLSSSPGPSASSEVALLSVEIANTQSLKISWGDTSLGIGVQGATYYIVSSSTDGGKNWQDSAPQTGLSLTQTQLTAGATYLFKVSAGNATEGLFSTSSIREGVPIQGFVLQTGSSYQTDPTSFYAEWGDALGATHYVVSLNGVPQVTVSDTFVTLSNLTPGTSYTLRVAATNDQTTGALASTKTKTWVQQGIPVPPSQLTATPAGGTAPFNAAVNLHWTASPDTSISGYTITNETIGQNYYTSALQTSFTDTQAFVGTANSYSVFSYNNAGKSTAVSASVSPITSFSLSPPILLSSSSVQLSWSAASGASHYQVRYGTSSGNYASTLATVDWSTTTQTLTGLNPHTSYFFQVVASNSSGSLPSSNEVSRTALNDFNYHWTFGTPSQYILSPSSLLQIASNQVSLIASSSLGDQTDQTTAQFNQGTPDASLSIQSNQVSLLRSTPNNASFGAHWTPQYAFLMGYWSLDQVGNGGEITGLRGDGSSIPGNFVDPSGNPVAGGSLVAGGKVNGSLLWNGSSDRVWVSTSQGLTPYTAASVALWFKTTQKGVSLFSNHLNATTSGSNTNSLHVNLDAGSNLCSVSDWQSGDQSVICSSGTSYADNQWHQLVTTISSSSGNHRLYVDGILQAQAALNTQSFFYLAGFNLGYAIDQPIYYAGSLDEVGLWSTELSPSEVEILYSRQQYPQYQGVFTSRVFDSGVTGATWTFVNWFTSLPFGKPLLGTGAESQYAASVNNFSQNLAAYWAFDETSGTVFSDSSSLSTSPQNSPAGIGSTEITLGGAGPFGHSLGMNLGFLSVAQNTQLVLTEDFTFAGWFYVPTGSNTHALYLLSKALGGIASPFHWFLTSSLNPTLSLGNGSSSVTFSSSSPVPLDQWFHLATTWNTQTGTITHFLNGMSIGSQTVSASLGDSGNGMVIGGGFGLTRASTGFTGQIDELAIWNGRRLLASEITELYRRGANKVSLQVRSCSAADCSDQPSWKGPSGNTNSVFADKLASSGPPLLNLVGVASNRYAQYRAILESSDVNSSPDLSFVHLGPDRYSQNQPSVTTLVGPSFSTLSDFSETAACAGGIRYEVSLDGTNWYTVSDHNFFNSSGVLIHTGDWTPSTGGWTTASSATTIQGSIGQLPAQVGNGTLFIRAYLNSTGNSSCALSQVSVLGMQ